MMNQEDIFRKIGLILEELQDQYAYLARNQQQLNELELELFMANASFLSDHVQIVRKLNSAKILKEIPAHTSPDPVPEISAAVTEISWDKPSSPEQNFGHQNATNISSETVLETQAQIAAVDVSVIEETTISAVEIPMEESPVLEAIPAEKPVFQSPVIAEAPEYPGELFTEPSAPATFEFIFKDSENTDKFDFEEKAVDDIFDRPLTAEEEQIIAQKQKLRDQEAADQERVTEKAAEPVASAPEPVAERKALREEDDEIGPEPFLVAKEVFVAKEEDLIPPAHTTLQVDPIAEKIIEEKKVEERVAPEAIPVQQPVAEAKAPETPAKPLSLNERLASQLGTNLNTGSSAPQKNTLTDLKQGINLNDKMLYIKDLFNGYNLAYAEVIDLLNKMADLKTADHFLQHNYAEKNNWASKPGTVAKFYELLKQRFPAG
ncbi:hypothetical protein [Pedobacter gandavensis]|uniref:hypothetical protein n=1 Tax=Pedobacter gandavensis TaxID=2679963 RepID=UPI002930F7C6|nr:hypothetical protein [Pedobacter gandavensis]